jgi:hypothetical protein
MGDRYLDRREAAEYLTSQRGLRVSRNSLQKMATLGGGPLYRRFGIRAVYTIDDLDAWASAKLSAPRRSTSETLLSEVPHSGTDNTVGGQIVR